MLQIFVDFSALAETRVHKSEHDSSARERAPFRVIVAPLFRDAMTQSQCLSFFRVRFTLFRVLLWTLKQLRARDPPVIAVAGRRNREQGRSESLENFFTATMAYADFKKIERRFIVSFTPLRGST